MRTLPAEWAPQAAVQLTFPHDATDWADTMADAMPVFLKIAETIIRFQPLVVATENVKKTRALFPPALRERVFFVECTTNDTWARDHAGITVFENGRPRVLNFQFNGWGLKFPANLDNQITPTMARKGVFKKIFGQRPSFTTSELVLEGGSLESDGEGTLLTTAECLLSPNRNPTLSKNQIEKKLKKLFGLDRVLWLENGALEGDDTDAHIDTLARFCDPETIAFQSCDDPTDAHFEGLKKMEAELAAFRTKKGQPYRLFRLPWPEPCFSKTDGHRLPATYANFLIINDAVLAPTYRVPQDAAALEVLRKCFPKREVIGIDCRPIIEQHGSLHCLTMQFPSAAF